MKPIGTQIKEDEAYLKRADYQKELLRKLIAEKEKVKLGGGQKAIEKQKAKGKLFPFGWYYLKKALKNPKVVDLMLTGIVPEYQGKGVAAILINELQKVMLEHGVTEVETTGIIETNNKAILNWKNYDHIQHKRKRCWKHDLTTN